MIMKNKRTKVSIIILAVIFLIAAGLLLLEMWDKLQGNFGGDGVKDGIVTYQGKEYVLKKNIETFLVLGLDKYDNQDTADSHNSGVQADFLTLFVFNNDTQQCTAIQINRDTMTKVNMLSVGGTSVVGTYTKQIALAYNYVNDDNDKVRCRNTKDSVEYLLKGITVNHYLSLTMDVVPVMADAVDGVELEVMHDFSGTDDTLVKGETVTLRGEQALRYVRSRYGIDDSSNGSRMQRQKQFMTALYNKALTCMENDEEFIFKIVDAVNKHVVYDSSDMKMQKFAEKFNSYEFIGFKEFEGETKYNEFVEFYPDDDSVWDVIIPIFYDPKA